MSMYLWFLGFTGALLTWGTVCAAQSLPFRFYGEIPQAEMRTLICPDDGEKTPRERVRMGLFTSGEEAWMVLTTPSRFYIRNAWLGWLGHYGRDGELEVDATVQGDDLKKTPCQLLLGDVNGRLA